MNTTKNPTTNPESMTFTHKIGSTVYDVSIHFKDNCRETPEDKILRMLKNDLTNAPKCDIIKELQTERMPGGLL